MFLVFREDSFYYDDCRNKRPFKAGKIYPFIRSVPIYVLINGIPRKVEDKKAFNIFGSISDAKEASVIEKIKEAEAIKNCEFILFEIHNNKLHFKYSTFSFVNTKLNQETFKYNVKAMYKYAKEINVPICIKYSEFYIDKNGHESLFLGKRFINANNVNMEYLISLTNIFN